MVTNLATDPEATKRYDEGGSWGIMSEGWPETPYTIGKWLLCTKANLIPYGQYVAVGAKYTYPHTRQSDGSWYDYSYAKIRCATEELKNKLDIAYKGMFIDCKSILKKEFE